MKRKNKYVYICIASSIFLILLICALVFISLSKKANENQKVPDSTQSEAIDIVIDIPEREETISETKEAPDSTQPETTDAPEKKDPVSEETKAPDTTQPVATTAPETKDPAPEGTKAPEPTQPAETETPEKNETVSERVERLLNEMTLEEKIYQLFIVTPEQLTGVSTVTDAGSITKTKLREYPVGGLIYFSKNLISPTQTKNMLSGVQAFAKEIEGVPLLLCVDEEGGRVARIAKNPAFGVNNVGEMGNVSSAKEAYECGYTIGGYLSGLGFNVDLAPDADVITNSSNTVIGDRSFGTNPDIVTEYSVAYSNGLHANHVLSTFKHFPGHGATEADTHDGYAYTNKSYAELYEADLKPFAAAQKNNVDLVMAAHISVPNVIGDDTPCSLSYKMITEILRGELKYDGLVITDALNMGAVSKNYSASSAAVKAVQAGVDILLMPEDLQEAFSGIYEAVRSGEITEDRIDDSVRRILKAKLNLK